MENIKNIMRMRIRSRLRASLRAAKVMGLGLAVMAIGMTDRAFCMTVMAKEAADLTEKADSRLHASVQHSIPSPEWVRALPQAKDEDTHQLFIVAAMGMDKTTASVSMHRRGESGEWEQILSSPGYVGRNGMCYDEGRVAGCGQTPIGVYHFTKAFGISPDPGCPLPYTQVDSDLYWSGDVNCKYNQMVRLSENPGLDVSNSEHLIDYEYQYQYCLNISFNEAGTPGRGSAIFLHCLGPARPYTGGCVAIPENIMELVMQNVSEDCVVVIDTLEKLGGSL